MPLSLADGFDLVLIEPQRPHRRAAFFSLFVPLSSPPSNSPYFLRPYIQYHLQSPFTPVFVRCLLTWPSVDIWLTAPSVLRTVRKRCENREISTLHTNDNMHSRALKGERGMAQRRGKRE